ncbi:MAG: TlpA disulfide reductase family protein [Sulfuricella sp.]
MRRIVVALCMILFASAAMAENFSFKDIAGKQHSLSGYRGKWVLVNFWATWCPPCLAEIPDLIALHDQHKSKDLAVIGIAMEYSNPGLVTDFARSRRITYPVALGNDEIAAQIGPVKGLPTTYLFNPQGKIVAHNVGSVTKEAVENFMARNK